MPVAGSVVQDTGAPTITLTLSRNLNYAERGSRTTAPPTPARPFLLPGNQPASRIVPKARPVVRPG